MINNYSIKHLSLIHILINDVIYGDAEEIQQFREPMVEVLPLWYRDSGYLMTIWILFVLSLPLIDYVVLLVGIKVRYL